MIHKDLRREIRVWLTMQDLSVKKACEKADVNYNSIVNQLDGRTAIKLGSFMELVQAIDEKYTINKEFKIVRR